MDRELTSGLDLSLGLVTCDSEPTVTLLTGRGLQIELRICSKLESSLRTESSPLGWTCHLVESLVTVSLQ